VGDSGEFFGIGYFTEDGGGKVGGASRPEY
jgi:hypothetical protein